MGSKPYRVRHCPDGSQSAWGPEAATPTDYYYSGPEHGVRAAGGCQADDEGRPALPGAYLLEQQPGSCRCWTRRWPPPPAAEPGPACHAGFRGCASPRNPILHGLSPANLGIGRPSVIRPSTVQPPAQVTRVALRSTAGCALPALHGRWEGKNDTAGDGQREAAHPQVRERGQVEVRQVALYWVGQEVQHEVPDDRRVRHACHEAHRKRLSGNQGWPEENSAHNKLTSGI